MKGRKSLASLLVPVVSLLLLVLSGCTGASAQSIKGMLQAADGKEVVVTLDDGTVVRLSVQNAESAAKAKQLVGEMVEVKIRGDKREMVEAKRLGEDQNLTGVIESIGAGAWTIGGRTIKVTPSTVLDGGLMVGVVARVEVVKMADGSLVAKGIETDNEDDEFSGKIESISADKVVIGGKTFRLGEATMLDKGLAAGVMARVEFVAMPNGTLQAIEVETEQDDFHFQGAIESMGAESFVIGGKTFKVNAATMLDNGLVQGVIARVEFITMSDGSLVAKEIETDRVEMERRGRGREAELRGREQELRGREQELERREQELRGREQELRGREQEVRGKAAEGEVRGKAAEGEVRGKAAEGEVSGKANEGEVSGREAEGEAPSGSDSGGSSGGGSGSGSGK